MSEQPTFIKTHMGDIACFINKVDSNKIPIIFLHGLYLDHNSWNNQIANITDRTTITIDMPMHGQSKGWFKSKWSLDDCGKMLLVILEKLNYSKVYAVGQSWGSMTILRAACLQPNFFKAVVLGNMPFKKTKLQDKIIYKLLHLSVFVSQEFYGKKAFEFLFSKESVKNPALYKSFQESYLKLTQKEIINLDDNVRIFVEDSEQKINSLPVKAIVYKGKEDYVPVPNLKTKIIEGGHMSHIESPNEVNSLIKELLDSTKD